MAQPTKTPSTTSGVRHATSGGAAVLEISQAMFDAFNTRQIDRALALCADNCKVYVVPTNQTYRGKNGMREYMQSWISAMPDCSAEIKHQHASGDAVVTEFHGHGVHTGILKTPMGDIGPTQKTLDLDFCEVAEFQEGKLVAMRTYFDVATLMRQLGLQK